MVLSASRCQSLFWSEGSKIPFRGVELDDPGHFQSIFVLQLPLPVSYRRKGQKTRVDQRPVTKTKTLSTSKNKNKNNSKGTYYTSTHTLAHIDTNTKPFDYEDLEFSAGLLWLPPSLLGVVARHSATHKMTFVCSTYNFDTEDKFTLLFECVNRDWILCNQSEECRQTWGHCALLKPTSMSRYKSPAATIKKRTKHIFRKRGYGPA